MDLRRVPTAMAGTMATVLLFAVWAQRSAPPMGGYHGARTDGSPKSGDSALTYHVGTWFASAGRCAGCHGSDPLEQASLNASGHDVNVVDDWRSTLMANSARDPFFLATMDHEGLLNPEQKTNIENKCLSCHAPLGMHEQRLLGLPPFTAAMLDTSKLGQDGVSCLACHALSPGTAGVQHSGALKFDSAQVYGPYENDMIVQEIMQFFVGLTPQFGSHMVDGRACAGCHTLVNETLGTNGQPNGGTFVEQATWHEWKNSAYNAGAESVTCGSCHLPRTQDSIVLAAGYSFLPGRAPFGLHHLVGGNHFMLQLLKTHRMDLDIPASGVQFDSTLARTMANLQQRTAQLEVLVLERSQDTVYFDVRVTNLTGHKFPSGFPSRRAVLQVAVCAQNGDTLFHSGALSAEHALLGLDEGYEPHHDVITQAEQVQVYEMVMADEGGLPTTLLARAADALKDDRLPPLGFSTGHPAYDTTRIVGVPLSDVDFGRDVFGFEGSGSDVVHYHAGLGGWSDNVTITARLLYQPLPPEWNTVLFSATSARIDTFRTWYADEEAAPITVAENTTSLGPLGLQDGYSERIPVYPNPAWQGVVFVPHMSNSERVWAVYDTHGHQVPVRTDAREGYTRVTLPNAAGTYLLRIGTAGHQRLERVVRP
jgi:hypothetical protein